jgi:hypothetical protein
VFDNEASPTVGPQSRAIDVSLNFSAHTANLVHALLHPGTPELAPSQGSVQLLPDGYNFVGWGQTGVVSELDSTGQLTFDMALPANTSTYRAYRYPWSATPASKPAVVARQVAGGTVNVYASWNGATAVASWQLLAGTSASTLTPLTKTPSTGFETQISAPTTKTWFAVQALNAAGQVLGTSAPVVD